ncbi:hypothetical protein AB0I22_12615 [Streptomyces sp. NPDC050610]|uniref:hypothetical protein n=1 Tax=Streptomyces sp. NPDC050610 TaxID=3157097 RepID=UPI003413D509
MYADLWTVVGDTDRDQWEYTPLTTVGPLQFGMSPSEAATRMTAAGFTGDLVEMHPWNSQRSQHKAEFRKTQEREPYQTDVTAYYVEGVGLTCIVVDGLSGPQVSFDGMGLIGRIPSQLMNELGTYLAERDMGFTFTPQGDIANQELGFMPGVQRAGDMLLTRAVFANPDDRIVYTLDDVIPGEVWGHH